MRQIKFRGLRNGKFLIGDLMHDFNGKTYIFTRDETTDSPDNYEVDPETVGQFTGLKDKLEIELVETDIVKTPKGHVCEIVWDTVIEEWRGDVFKYTGFALRNIKSNTLYHFDDPESFEKIGDRYRNPELLKP